MTDNPMEELAQDATLIAGASMLAESVLVREATRVSEEEGTVLLRAALILTRVRLERQARS